MKNIVLISLLFAGFVSCMDDTVKIGDELGSKSTGIVYYSNVILKGKETMVLKLGTPFTDPGATGGTSDGKPATPTVEGAVDVNTMGIYFIKYEVEDTKGTATAIRTIAVVSASKPVKPDYSGEWRRNAGAEGISVWIQRTPDTYFVSNPGGAGSEYTNFWCVATVTGGVPMINAQDVPQEYGGEPVNINTTSSSAFTGNNSNDTYTWALNTPGYGTGSRTFVKQ